MKTPIVYAGLIVLFGTIGVADTINLKDVLTELLQRQKQVAGMTVQSADLDKQETSLKAKDTKIKNAEKGLERQRGQLVMDNNANETKKAEALQSGCRPGETTSDTALATRCNGLAAQINATTARIETRAQQLITQNTQNVKDRAQLSKDTLAWAANRKHLNAAINDLNARINALRAFLLSQCTSIPASVSDEEIKNKCGNIQFDGAAPNLPPCLTEECRQYERSYSAR